MEGSQLLIERLSGPEVTVWYAPAGMKSMSPGPSDTSHSPSPRDFIQEEEDKEDELLLSADDRMAGPW